MNSLPAAVEDAQSPLDPDQLAEALSPYLKPDKKQQGLQAVTMMIRKFHSGPLPDPETLAGYETILSGAAERIMLMAELEQRHRHRQEGRMVAGEYLVRLIGQLGAMIAIALLAGLAAFCAWLQQPIAAGVITAIGVAGAAFLRFSVLYQTRPPNGPPAQPPAAKRTRGRPKR